MANSTAAVSEFKAHLSEYLRHVQNGDEITILDHKRPIARVVPIEKESLRDRLGIIPAKKKKFRDIRPKGIKLDIDPAQYVIEDREDRLP
ncbi:type II toxin-antitoxin system Phd/YefM family antitoxin [Turneriella parva]|uniref:Antitoxin n=1 Tax=Turneriella parva (strain ATCC BAA-1111 / DSM 21527 / NCTC 11395 / H) TaxID=869212 RepID=I4B993_TURPD|nr:type II toxin-antitoxin system prevent-host-death family antitoxin [Turneriella parva]AFM13850.1 prevent-host-death family protein [Turneriella parva DSM 21527]